MSDRNFTFALRQKGVDKRIRLDIASITLKRQADEIILVSVDVDSVPAAKFPRREGVRFILNPLWQDVPAELFIQIDRPQKGFFKPSKPVA